jgi:signal transduction histidine kinase/ActR/RegA family two-component response regulator
LGFFEIHNKRDGSAFSERDCERLLAVSQVAAVAIQNAMAYQQLQRAEAALKEADQRKDEFLATLAHELRNPLAPIRNAVELLRRIDDADPQVEQARSILERQSSQMVRLIDDLLDINRITRNKLELRLEPVQLAAVMDNALEASRPLFEAMNHKLTVHLPDESVWLDADPTRLAQVFANLLTNAAKYTDPQGHISVRAIREGGSVRIAFKDNGIGVAPEHLPRVFEMFSQAKTALERSQGGLGIGLALVRGLVEMHGGEIRASSEGLGHGSEFNVTLPVASSKSPRFEPSNPEAVQARVAARRVLVADDNRDSAETLALLLGSMGHKVHTAFDGQEAVTSAAALHPDVIILDIGMPRLNGYDAARLIRQQPGGHRTVLIAMTGWGQQEDKVRAEQAGFDVHMTKPVDAATLQTILSTLSVDAAN